VAGDVAVGRFLCIRTAPIVVMERIRSVAGSVYSISYVQPNPISGTCRQYPAACGVPDTAKLPTNKDSGVPE